VEEVIVGGFCVLGFLLLAAAAEFGAGDEKVSRETSGEREKRTKQQWVFS
jgi:hypothetical protein